MNPLTHLSRRQFLSSTLAATATGSAISTLSSRADEPKPAAPGRKIKIGLIGCGGRGHWLMPYFMKHGGYEL